MFHSPSWRPCFWNYYIACVYLQSSCFLCRTYGGWQNPKHGAKEGRKAYWRWRTINNRKYPGKSVKIKFNFVKYEYDREYYYYYLFLYWLLALALFINEINVKPYRNTSPLCSNEWKQEIETPQRNRGSQAFFFLRMKWVQCNRDLQSFSSPLCHFLRKRLLIKR